MDLAVILGSIAGAIALGGLITLAILYVIASRVGGGTVALPPSVIETIASRVDGGTVALPPSVLVPDVRKPTIELIQKGPMGIISNEIEENSDEAKLGSGFYGVRYNAKKKRIKINLIDNNSIE